ncbi:C39 family peptidase [Candidatus Berkelbacteria bacterium]|nr:C39 family peptidase [Candidatus Berkelbacteria bacterium]
MMKQAIKSGQKLHSRILLLILVTALGLWLGPGQRRIAIKQYEQTAASIQLPEVTPANSQPVNQKPAPESNAPNSEPDSLPAQVNLNVPFTSQAPEGVWDTRHEEYCEEASTLMVGRFFRGESIVGPKDAEAAMRELESWEVKNLGYSASTTAAETAQLLEAVYAVGVKLENNVSSEALKRALANNKLVIVPAAGQELGNPYFKQPGPRYHMLVVKGYTNTGYFITNDPGTKRGANFLYKEKILLDAIGDYNNNNPAEGAKVALIVSNRP